MSDSNIHATKDLAKAILRFCGEHCESKGMKGPEAASVVVAGLIFSLAACIVQLNSSLTFSKVVDQISNILVEIEDSNGSS